MVKTTKTSNKQSNAKGGKSQKAKTTTKDLPKGGPASGTATPPEPVLADGQVTPTRDELAAISAAQLLKSVSPKPSSVKPEIPKQRCRDEVEYGGIVTKYCYKRDCAFDHICGHVSYATTRTPLTTKFVGNGHRKATVPVMFVNQPTLQEILTVQECLNMNVVTHGNDVNAFSLPGRASNHPVSHALELYQTVSVMDYLNKNYPYRPEDKHPYAFMFVGIKGSRLDWIQTTLAGGRLRPMLNLEASDWSDSTPNIEDARLTLSKMGAYNGKEHKWVVVFWFCFENSIDLQAAVDTCFAIDALTLADGEPKVEAMFRNGWCSSVYNSDRFPVKSVLDKVEGLDDSFNAEPEFIIQKANAVEKMADGSDRTIVKTTWKHTKTQTTVWHHRLPEELTGNTASGLCGTIQFTMVTETSYFSLLKIRIRAPPVKAVGACDSAHARMPIDYIDAPCDGKTVRVSGNVVATVFSALAAKKSVTYDEVTRLVAKHMLLFAGWPSDIEQYQTILMDQVRVVMERLAALQTDFKNDPLPEVAAIVESPGGVAGGLQIVANTVISIMSVVNPRLGLLAPVTNLVTELTKARFPEQYRQADLYVSSKLPNWFTRLAPYTWVFGGLGGLLRYLYSGKLHTFNTIRLVSSMFSTQLNGQLTDVALSPLLEEVFKALLPPFWGGKILLMVESILIGMRWAREHPEIANQPIMVQMLTSYRENWLNFAIRGIHLIMDYAFEKIDQTPGNRIVKFVISLLFHYYMNDRIARFNQLVQMREGPTGELLYDAGVRGNLDPLMMSRLFASTFEQPKPVPSEVCVCCEKVDGNDLDNCELPVVATKTSNVCKQFPFYMTDPKFGKDCALYIRGDEGMNSCCRQTHENNFCLHFGPVHFRDYCPVTFTSCPTTEVYAFVERIARVNDVTSHDPRLVLCAAFSGLREHVNQNELVLIPKSQYLTRFNERRQSLLKSKFRQLAVSGAVINDKHAYEFDIHVKHECYIIKLAESWIEDAWSDALVYGYNMAVEPLYCKRPKPRNIAEMNVLLQAYTAPFAHALPTWMKHICDLFSDTVTYTYTSGLTTVEMADEVETGADMVYFWSDASAMEAHWAIEHHFVMLLMLAHLGLPVEVIHELEVILRPFTIRGSTFKGVADHRMPSGRYDTGVGTTLIKILLIRTAVKVFQAKYNRILYGFVLACGDDDLIGLALSRYDALNFTAIFKRVALDFGLDISMGMTTNIYRFEYCSSVLMPIITKDGRKRKGFVPKPGRMLAKLGWVSSSKIKLRNNRPEYWEKYSFAYLRSKMDGLKHLCAGDPIAQMMMRILWGYIGEGPRIDQLMRDVEVETSYSLKADTNHTYDPVEVLEFFQQRYGIVFGVNTFAQMEQHILYHYRGRFEPRCSACEPHPDVRPRIVFSDNLSFMDELNTILHIDNAVADVLSEPTAAPVDKIDYTTVYRRYKPDGVSYGCEMIDSVIEQLHSKGTVDPSIYRFIAASSPNTITAEAVTEWLSSDA